MDGTAVRHREMEERKFGCGVCGANRMQTEACGTPYLSVTKFRPAAGHVLANHANHYASACDAHGAQVADPPIQCFIEPTDRDIAVPSISYSYVVFPKFHHCRLACLRKLKRASSRADESQSHPLGLATHQVRLS